MITINNKYDVGQEVWRLRKYPAGARIFHGKVHEINVVLTEEDEVRVHYYFNDGFKIPFTELDVFDSEEEAEIAKNEWCNKPEVKECADRLHNGLQF